MGRPWLLNPNIIFSNQGELMEASDSERKALFSVSDPVITKLPEALLLVLLSIHPVLSRPCSAPGVDHDIIRQYSERLLHEFTLYLDNSPDRSLSVFFYLKDQESKWELFAQYWRDAPVIPRGMGILSFHSALGP